jgi:hypothetical protein
MRIQQGLRPALKPGRSKPCPLYEEKRTRMNAEYFICWYRLDSQDRYLIWHTNDEDGVFLRDGKVPVFSEQAGIVEFAEQNGIKLQAEEPGLHDLDVIANWLKNPNKKTVDCPAFNAAWNLFADVSRSVKGEFDQDQKKTNKIYEKLFCGSNLPAVTPEGKEYEPIWARQEVEILMEVLTEGLKLFRSKIAEVQPG